MSGEAEWLATLRPSRTRDVPAGATSWTTVDLVDIGSGHGSVLREALETFGVRVNRFPVGQARHLVQVLWTRSRAPFVVLACHGDGGSIVIPGWRLRSSATSPTTTGSAHPTCAPSLASRGRP